MTPRVPRCPFSCGRKVFSGAGLILVLALSACGTSHDLGAGRSSNPAVPAAAAFTAAPVISATPKTGAAHSSHVRHVASVSARRDTAAKSNSTSAAKTTHRPRTRHTRSALHSGGPTTADLQAALLTTADMPAGYTVEPGDGSGLAGSSISGCPVLAGNPAGVTEQASVGLADPPHNPSMGETLLQLSRAHAAAAMAGYASIATDCGQFSAVVGNYNVTFTTQPLAIGALGDQATAVHLTGRIASANAPIYVDFAVIRHGSTLIVIVDVSLTSDTSFTAQIAGKAFAKVAARW